MPTTKRILKSCENRDSHVSRWVKNVLDKKSATYVKAYIILNFELNINTQENIFDVVEKHFMNLIQSVDETSTFNT
ncbi:CLUMA_CG010880, isoform A [Clunio marinus]|uniref:CLUMA_CG010880, isoform A n=1 Tax=Clunio marinus TaxID=568069 RepID=A0A1J1IBA4_9DIPT|nr:CLUMA_CG010880, isoform A [Clunio marinus]